MNRDRYQGICKQLGGRLMQQWGALAGDAAAVAAGSRKRREGGIQEQRGIARRSAERQLADFINRNRRWRDLSS